MVAGLDKFEKKKRKRLILSEDAFMAMLYLEQRRAERGRRRYVLLLVDIREAITGKRQIRKIETVGETLCAVMRETDIVGWHLDGQILGVIITEIGAASDAKVRARISQKLSAALVQALGSNVTSQISICFFFRPDESMGSDEPGAGASETPPSGAPPGGGSPCPTRRRQAASVRER